jgi:hypothetical protein
MRNAVPARTPPSYGQQRFWFLQQWKGDSSLCNLPPAPRPRGDLNTEAPHAALDDVVTRHERLRTIFRVRHRAGAVFLVHSQLVLFETAGVPEAEGEGPLDASALSRYEESVLDNAGILTTFKPHDRRLVKPRFV